MTWIELERMVAVRLEALGLERPDRLAADYITDAFSPARKNESTGVTEQVLTKVERDTERLGQGEPLAYVTSVTHFYGLSLEVNRSTLIPRSETEELVRWILESHDKPNIHFVDLCTGSGAIAAALAYNQETWRGLAVDISQDALVIAEENMKRLGVSKRVATEFHDALTEEDYLGEGADWDLIVCNPPYIPDSDWVRVDPTVASYEPHLALRVPSATPLQFYHAVEHTARHQLSFGGALYFECNDRYTAQVHQLLEFEGWGGVETLYDMQGKPRHVRGYAG